MKQPVTTGLDPVLPVRTLFCIGRNYALHAREMNQRVPEHPMIFLKPASSIIHDGETVILPRQSKEIHHEIELIAAIGKSGKNIPAHRALDYVAGYGVGIDVTARDIQQKAKEKSHPWTVAKGFDTFAPLSVFVPAGQITDPQNLDLELKVNGAIRQHGNTKDMIFPVATLVSYISTIFTLAPGDLIFTGTPDGVSPINHGDTITASLNNQLITLTVTVSSP